MNENGHLKREPLLHLPLGSRLYCLQNTLQCVVSTFTLAYAGGVFRAVFGFEIKLPRFKPVSSSRRQG